MTLLENEITQNNVDRAKIAPELLKRRETEAKFIPHDPSAFQELRSTAVPIEQFSLNQYGEEFELRVRSEYHPDGTYYTATLKDRGEVRNGALDRLEIETPITKEAYEYYCTFPVLRQLRAKTTDGITVDFIENEPFPRIEIEADSDEELQTLAASLADTADNISGEPEGSKNYLAHKHDNFEHTYDAEPLEEFSHRIVRDMVAQYVGGVSTVVVGITGMSGSGKTTVTSFIREELIKRFGTDFEPLIVSTDDYHFGKKYLDATYGSPWTEWDDPRTYNIEELAHDLAFVKQGLPLQRRHFDFHTEEPSFDNEAPHAPFVVVEGLYAGSADLSAVRNLHYTLPTGIATAVGRDVRRLVVENRANRAFPDPESRLRYQIETAIPTYLYQERPAPHTFCASMRPLAERAFMLHQLSEPTTLQR